MAQKVRSGSVTPHRPQKVTYSRGSGPDMPVTWDPESQPQGLTSAIWTSCSGPWHKCLSGLCFMCADGLAVLI